MPFANLKLSLPRTERFRASNRVTLQPGRGERELFRAPPDSARNRVIEGIGRKVRSQKVIDGGPDEAGVKLRLRRLNLAALATVT